MTGVEAVGAVSEAAPQANVQPVQTPQQVEGSASFAQMFAAGLEHVEGKVDAANEIVREFAVDDSVPVHEVTIALEEARMAVELALQVRTRVVEAYREMMNMQL